ncbi:MAG TPA: hypothetical protein VF594_06160, partial [Rubricoccaceae bacterium]
MNATTALRSLLAAPVWGHPLARVGVLALLAVLALPARAQMWEALPLVPNRSGHSVFAIDFLRGEGAAASDPTADTLVWFSQYGPLLYNPSGAAGAAGSNGDFGVWHRLCSSGTCAGRAGLLTSAGTFLVGSGAGATRLSRGTNRGRTWALNYENYGADPFFEATVPSAAGPDGRPAVLIGIGDGGETARSPSDG